MLSYEPAFPSFLAEREFEREQSSDFSNPVPNSHTAVKTPSGNHWSFQTTELIISNQDRIYLSQRGIFYLNPSGFCDLRKGTSSCLSSVSSPRKWFHQKLFTQLFIRPWDETWVLGQLLVTGKCSSSDIIIMIIVLLVISTFTVTCMSKDYKALRDKK